MSNMFAISVLIIDTELMLYQKGALVGTNTNSTQGWTLFLGRQYVLKLSK
jgi:hypothetical protein